MDNKPFCLILFLSAVLTNSIFAGTYSGGTGEPNTPYLIADVNDLLEMSSEPNDWSSNFLLIDDINLSGIVFDKAPIAPDTDNSNMLFDGVSFTGTFDGNNFKIVALTIEAGDGEKYLGLFGKIDLDSQITNLGLEDINIQCSSNSYDLGALCGFNDGIISNCYATGSIYGAVSVGGLCGFNYYGTISDCYAAGFVIAGDNSFGIGGLCGRNLYGTVSDCYAKGSVTAGNDSDSLGGLVGGNTAVITDCYSTGSVIGGENSDNLGGLCGNNFGGTINGSYATGSIIADTNSSNLGGLCGTHAKGAGAILILKSSKANLVTSANDSPFFDDRYGRNYPGTIRYCYATGSITSGNDSNSLGGLCGKNWWGDINDCYATGSVTAGSDSCNLGGLCGYNGMFSTINGCYFLDTAGHDNGLGIPLTDSQMKKQTSFLDWDFATPIWMICEAASYPWLWWETINSPVINDEPELTFGNSNTISWQFVDGDIGYYVICCSDPNLDEVVANSGWIEANEFTFGELETGLEYFYAVKAMKNCVLESDFSQVVSSTQVTLADAVDLSLDPNSLKNQNMANALSNKLDVIQNMIDKGEYATAISKLESDILSKMDGCPQTSEPDKNDWIITCEQQGEIYSLVLEAIEYLRNLME